MSWLLALNNKNMKTSIDISYYPLNEEYKAPIKKFVESLQQQPNIAVKPNSMSTQVFGDYDAVMTAISHCMKNAMKLPHSVFVLKVMNADRNK